jgi:hypothetical protein
MGSGCERDRPEELKEALFLGLIPTLVLSRGGLPRTWIDRVPTVYRASQRLCLGDLNLAFS